MMEIKHLKKGSYIMHKGEPALIKAMGLVVTGTHSHGKMKLDVQGIFSKTNDSFTLPLHERVEEAEITRKLGQLLSRNLNHGQVMDMQSYETFDSEIEEGVNAAEGDEVTFIEHQGKALVVEKR